MKFYLNLLVRVILTSTGRWLKTLNLSVREESQVLRKKNNTVIQLSLFEDVYEEEFKFNDLEKKTWPGIWMRTRLLSGGIES